MTRIKAIENKYVNAETKEVNHKKNEEDKKIRFEMAMADGGDPQGEFSTKELWDDWQFMRMYNRKYNK